MFKRVLFVVLSVALIAAYESAIGQPQEIKTPTTEEALAVDQKLNEQIPAEETSNHEEVIEEEPRYLISRFDDIMRKVGEEQGHDWRFMSAIAYHESRFIENLVSARGAKGIMQIRPVVARHFKVPVETINDTETNVRLAGMLLTELDDMLRIPASTPEQDRLSILLAGYNAGVGHVLDARRLARMEGANPNSWDVVSRYLQLKGTPEYYQLDVVKCGKFSGGRQTISYVKQVMHKYSQYKSL